MTASLIVCRHFLVELSSSGHQVYISTFQNMKFSLFRLWRSPSATILPLSPVLSCKKCLLSGISADICQWSRFKTKANLLPLLNSSTYALCWCFEFPPSGFRLLLWHATSLGGICKAVLVRLLWSRGGVFYMQHIVESTILCHPVLLLMSRLPKIWNICVFFWKN